MLYHTDWFADIQKSLHPWDKSHLIIVQKWKLFSCVWLFATPMDYKYHGILQVRILQWVAIPFSRVSSQPRDWTQVSRIAGRFFTNWAIVYIKLFMYCWICFANILLKMYVFLFILILVCNFFLWYHIKSNTLEIRGKRRKQLILLKIFMYENPSAVRILNGEILKVSILRLDIIQGYLLTIILFNITLKC